MIEVHSPQTFLDAAGPLLYQDEPVNSLMIGLAQAADSTTLLLTLNEGDQVATAALLNPSRPLVLTEAKENHLTALAAYLHEQGRELPAAVGPSAVAESFAKKWTSLTGSHFHLGLALKSMKIEKVKLASGIPGEIRHATRADIPLVAQWMHAFQVEAVPHEATSVEEITPVVTTRIDSGYVFLWNVNGAPVSLTAVARPTRNGIAVNSVYTPRNLRGHGYASVLVGRVTLKMFESGRKFCVLYTDAANPTSNKIYQDVGYRLIGESKHFVFSRSAQS